MGKNRNGGSETFTFQGNSALFVLNDANSTGQHPLIQKGSTEMIQLGLVKHLTKALPGLFAFFKLSFLLKA